MGIKHPFSSSKVDGADTTKVRPSVWNTDHVIDGDVDFAGHSLINADEVIVVDEAYNPTAWDGDLSVPTKNAVRDKIEALVLGGGGVTDFLALTDTPNSYSGFGLAPSGAVVRVNAAGTALEFKFGVDGWKNVRDYGAVGDSVADDTAAIQAALDDNAGFYGGLKDGTIFFPAGTYKLTSPIQFGGNNDIRFLGEGGAEITGNFNGYLFESVFGGFNYSSHSFENLRMNNSNTTPVTSGCIYFTAVITGLIKNCTIGTGGGIGVYQDTAQDVTLDTCVLVSDRTVGGIGFMAGNAAASINTDYVGWGTAAIQHRNIGLNVIGGRFEVSERGIVIGREASGSDSSSSCVFLSGLSMESNDIHIRVVNCNALSIQGVGMTSFNAGNEYGIFVTGGNGITLDAVGCGGTSYSVAAIAFDMTSPDVNILNVSVRNTNAFSWFVSPEVDTTTWFNTDYTPAFTHRYNKRGADTNIPPEPDIFPNTATIAAGVITVNANYMVIDTEAAAATDDLVTISGAQRGSTGSRLVLRAANSARTVVLKDNTGNLRLAGDFSLDNVEDTIQLLWDGNTGATGLWYEISRSDNGA